jgi:hypothetical protein
MSEAIGPLRASVLSTEATKLVCDLPLQTARRLLSLTNRRIA